MSSETNIPMEGLLDLMMMVVLDRIGGMEPAKVTKYDTRSQRVSIQPLIKSAHVDEKGTRISKTQAEIPEVLVWSLGNAGRITVPVKKGDLGIAIYCGRSLDVWKEVGGIVDPKDDRRHDRNDVIFVPGLHNKRSSPTPAPDDAIVTHGKTKIGGPTGTQPTIMATTWNSAFNTLIGSIVSALSGITPGAGAGVASALTTFNAALWKTTNTEVK